MAFWGIKPEDFDTENTVHVWPENWRAVEFMCALGAGSWNLGPGGAAGLRPEAYREIRLALGVTRQEWPPLFQALQVLQDGALEEIHRDDEE